VLQRSKCGERDLVAMAGRLPGVGRQVLAVVTVGAAVLLAGCSTAAYPSLPGLDTAAEKTLTPEEQQAKIDALAKAKADSQATIQPAVMTQPEQ
jgi:hypothetical protein